jgi:hypothetical protein
MLALVAGLGALYALFLAAAPVRDFFDLTLLKAGDWFLALLSAAAGLVLASVLWRLPYIQQLEGPQLSQFHPDEPAPIHTPHRAEEPAASRERSRTESA